MNLLINSVGNSVFSIALSIGWISLCTFAHATDFAQVEAFVQPRIYPYQSSPPERQALIENILKRPDPETFFSRYVFALERNSAKLLTEEQNVSLREAIDRQSPINHRWHDERNTLRCKFNQVMWRYAGTSDSAAIAIKEELAEWMRLRMLWTLHEHLASYELDRAVWQLLDTTQHKLLLDGAWKKYAKLDTGHTRANATDKIITRAMGKPDHPQAFEQALEAWTGERKDLHEALQSAEEIDRRAEFAMDLNSSALIQSTTEGANAAYAKLYLAEADAMRRIIHTGYDEPLLRCDRAAEDAWSEAKSRFSSGAAELIELLESP